MLKSNIKFSKRSALDKEIEKKITENANVFFSCEMEDLRSKDGEAIYYIYNEKYIMPVTVISKLCFKIGNFISEPFIYNDVAHGEEKEFLDDVVEYIKKNKIAHWICVTPASSFFRSYPEKSKRIRFGSHVIDLTQDEEALLMNMKSKHRNMVRRAEKEGIYVKFGSLDLLDEYVALDREMWARSGRTGDNTENYKKILQALKEKAFIAICYKEDEPQAAMLSYYNEEMMYYMYAASKTAPSPGSSNFLHWEVMKKMKQEGVKKYSFVGCRINEDENSKYHNIQRFKAGFGGELDEGYLFKITIDGLYQKLYNILIYLKTKQKVRDVIDDEMPKWLDIN